MLYIHVPVVLVLHCDIKKTHSKHIRPMSLPPQRMMRTSGAALSRETEKKGRRPFHRGPHQQSTAVHTSQTSRHARHAEVDSHGLCSSHRNVEKTVTYIRHTLEADQGNRHCYRVALIRNKPIRAYLVTLSHRMNSVQLR